MTTDPERRCPECRGTAYLVAKNPPTWRCDNTDGHGVHQVVTAEGLTIVRNCPLTFRDRAATDPVPTTTMATFGPEPRAL